MPDIPERVLELSSEVVSLPELVVLASEPLSELSSDVVDVLFELSLLLLGPQSSDATADGINDKVTATVVAPAMTADFTGLRNVFSFRVTNTHNPTANCFRLSNKFIPRCYKVFLRLLSPLKLHHCSN